MMAVAMERTLGHVPLSQLNSLQLAGIVHGWKARYAKHAAYCLRSRLRKFLKDAEQFGAPARLDETLPGPIGTVEGAVLDGFAEMA